MSPFLLVLALGTVAVHGAVNMMSADVRVAYERQLAEQDDERYLTVQWQALESELQLLSRALKDTGLKDGEMAEIQLHVAPKLNQTQNKANVNQTKKKGADVAAGIMSKLKGMDKSVMGQMALAPMLEMLKGLYDDQKKRISELNKREEGNKKRFEAQEADYKKSIAKIEERFKNHKISEGFHKNETHDAARAFDYWKRCRDRNHRQFHTSLKLTHATMEKEKLMIKSYEEALKTPEPTKKGARDFAKIAAQVGPLPDVEFVQTAEIVKFCSSTLAEVHSALGELQKATKGHHALRQHK